MVSVNGWADWDAFERRHGERFLAWAEPSPADLGEERYAVIVDSFTGHVVWARVSPNPDIHTSYSSGAFYDDMFGGAVEAAKRAAQTHKARVRTLVQS